MKEWTEQELHEERMRKMALTRDNEGQNVPDEEAKEVAVQPSRKRKPKR